MEYILLDLFYLEYILLDLFYLEYILLDLFKVEYILLDLFYLEYILLDLFYLEYILLDLFSFVSLISSCSLVPWFVVVCITFSFLSSVVPFQVPLAHSVNVDCSGVHALESDIPVSHNKHSDRHLCHFASLFWTYTIVTSIFHNKHSDRQL